MLIFSRIRRLGGLVEPGEHELAHRLSALVVHPLVAVVDQLEGCVPVEAGVEERVEGRDEQPGVRGLVADLRRHVGRHAKVLDGVGQGVAGRLVSQVERQAIQPVRPCHRAPDALERGEVLAHQPVADNERGVPAENEIVVDTGVIAGVAQTLADAVLPDLVGGEGVNERNECWFNANILIYGPHAQSADRLLAEL